MTASSHRDRAFQRLGIRALARPLDADVHVLAEVPR
jgi:hypothetical protein